MVGLAALWWIAVVREAVGRLLPVLGIGGELAGIRLGTRYLPSAFYKMRMIPFVSAAMAGRSYPVTGAGTANPANPGSAS